MARNSTAFRGTWNALRLPVLGVSEASVASRFLRARLPSSHDTRSRFERQARTAMPAPAATALDSGSRMSLSRTATPACRGSVRDHPAPHPPAESADPVRLAAPADASRRRSGPARRRVASPVAPAVSACSLPCVGGPPARDRQRRSAPTGLCLAAASRLVRRPPSSIGRDGKFCGRTVAELARQRR